MPIIRKKRIKIQQSTTANVIINRIGVGHSANMVMDERDEIARPRRLLDHDILKHAYDPAETSTIAIDRSENDDSETGGSEPMDGAKKSVPNAD